MTLVVEALSKHYGGLKAVDGVSFEARPSQITALIGPNGAGKTTLLNLVSGVTRPSSGRVTLFGTDVTQTTPHELAAHGLTRTYQSPQLFGEMSVLETVMVGAHLKGRAGYLAAMFRFGGVGREEAALEARARTALARVDMPESLHARPSAELSYGLQRRVEIARALATDPRIILLDEPVAGLNPSETVDISEVIQGLAKTGHIVLLVEHDMDMVMGISQQIVVMNFGQKIANGTPAEVQADPSVLEAYLGVAQGDS